MIGACAAADTVEIALENQISYFSLVNDSPCGKPVVPRSVTGINPETEGMFLILN